MRRARCILFALAALGGASCTVGPEYERPGFDAPPAFRGAASHDDPASVADLPWWEVFDDPHLEALVIEALNNNRDLRAAVARIEQARAIRQQVSSEFYPQIGYQAGVSRGKNEFIGSPAPNDGETQSAGAGVLSAFWEIDLWGRIRRADEAALASLLASEEAWRGLTLSLVSEVAILYFQLLALDDSIEISRRTVESFRESEELFSARADGGISSDLPVLRARAERALAEAAVPDLEKQVAHLENAVALLLARPPQPVPRGAASDPPPAVPVGIPSQLLERRPEVRRAEAILRRANAEIGVAEAEFFPRIGLSGLLGGVSPELSSLSGGTAALWSVAAQLSGPLFTGGRLEGELAAAKARWEESVANYDQTLYAALRDVADALVTRQKAGEAEVYLTKQVDSLTVAVELALVRYDAGRANYFEVVDSQQRLFPAELSRARNRSEQRVALVDLYRALGGGWNLHDDEWDPRRTASASSTPAAQK